MSDELPLIGGEVVRLDLSGLSPHTKMLVATEAIERHAYNLAVSLGMSWQMIRLAMLTGVLESVRTRSPPSSRASDLLELAQQWKQLVEHLSATLPDGEAPPAKTEGEREDDKAGG